MAETQARVILTHPPANNAPVWTLEEDVTVNAIKDDELLVEIISSGICHTDVVFSMFPEAIGGYPKVLGHEGAGYVVAVGSKVTAAAPGDPVLLSFTSCQSCKHCDASHPSFCNNFNPLNYNGDITTFYKDRQIHGSFFGQSSFASMTAVKETSVVNVKDIVKDKEDLKLFAPLGCGFQTGAGTVTNLAAATEADEVVILGLGGVGLTAIMGAKIVNAKTIIGVDRVPSRLELAQSLGATHVLNTSDPNLDLVAEIKKITGGNGASIVIDTTGVLSLIEKGIEMLMNRGQFIFVGVPGALDAVLTIPIVPFLSTGKIIRTSIEGDVIPSQYIKQMIEWYRQGKFPIDKLVKQYKAEDFATALHDMHTGSTIKPLLIW